MISDLLLIVSDKKIFKEYPIYIYVKHMTPEMELIMTPGI